MVTGTPPFDATDIQGNILRGYHFRRIRHLMLEVRDAAAARRWLGAALSGDGGMPVITNGADWGAVKPAACFNIGLTHTGLAALGVSAASLASFPGEFSDGMANRSVKLGDVGTSAPAHWDFPYASPKILHLVATIHSDDTAELDRIARQLVGDGGAFTVHDTRDGWNFDGDTVHFGYRDSISQPRFVGIQDPDAKPDGQPLSPLGTVLMGYPTEYEDVTWTIPQPDRLGRNGTFTALRILEQDVTGFEAYLSAAATTLMADPLGDELLPPGDEPRVGPGLSRHAALREVVAARMCGRWRNGVPLALSPDTPDPSPPVSLTDFDYRDVGGCPYGAHVRRCNPRSGAIVQRAARHTRRLVRRGVPYGPAYDPARPDSVPRGLLGSFICANLGAQFEALSCDWLNLGLQDPRLTGSNDPLLGANIPETSWFDIPLPSGRSIRLRGMQRFVHVRGGAYLFLPGIPAIRYLAGL